MSSSRKSNQSTKETPIREKRNHLKPGTTTRPLPATLKELATRWSRWWCTRIASAARSSWPRINPRGAPEPGVKGLSDFTAHLADRLGVPFNLGEAINFTHEELGSARRHHAAPPQRSGASAAVDPPGQPDPPPLQAPVQMAVQVVEQVVEQVAAPMPSSPAAPKPRPFS